MMNIYALRRLLSTLVTVPMILNSIYFYEKRRIFGLRRFLLSLDINKKYIKHLPDMYINICSNEL